MKIRLLKEGYKKDELLYEAFKNNEKLADDFFSNESVEIEDAPDFPIYMAKGSEQERKKEFLEAFKVLKSSYVSLDRDIHFNERFWHSLLIEEKRDYIINKYPKVLESYLFSPLTKLDTKSEYPLH